MTQLPERVVLDEVQRVPTLFSELKIAIDRRRVPGRFLLAGSAQVLLVPKLSDSLAGRMEILHLYPLAQCELVRKSSNFLDALFKRNFEMVRTERLTDKLPERIVAGGYPAALKRSPGHRRQGWYRNFVDTQIQRDIQDLTRVRSLDAIPKLVLAVASQTSELFNLSNLASSLEISRPAVNDYIVLLERLFLLNRLPSWSTNRLKRQVKAPKLHIGDTGIGCSLLELDADVLSTDRVLLGKFLETFVFQELKRLASWRNAPISIYHFRDRDGVEVDFVLEQSYLSVAGIEVKAAATVTRSDFKGLRKFKEAAGERFVCGVVLYDGELSVSFGEGFFALPIKRLWENPEG